MTRAQQSEQLIRSLPTMSELCLDDHDPDVFRSVLERVGDKWSLLVIGILGERPHRFTELLRIVPGISRRMLTVTLRALERDGIITRTIYAEVPPRVEYAVTDLGVSLGEAIRILAGWVAGHQQQIVTNRRAFDAVGVEAD
ncbi:winged helix-turn-helix transcriptional regulator [Microbacterium sp.]|uniref:winged helix-turn-helix transcriptional regulator n=1 Tax=Microbacterium sp. TaxID=51671 RepID=UPI003C75AD66